MTPSPLARLFLVGALLPALELQVQVQAEPFYFQRSKSGSILITNHPEKYTELQELKLVPSRLSGHAVWRLSGRRFSFKTLYPNKYQDLIIAASRAHGIAPSLIRAVIHAESAFNPHARSPKGARGLMQLMPDTARELGVINSSAPRDNIWGGTKYLRSMLERYQGNVRFALAAYNAGPGAVDEHRGIPPYSETREYVARVLELERRYRSFAG